MLQKKKEFLTMKEAFRKAANYCVYQERGQNEVREKLIFEYGQTEVEADEIIAGLIGQNFINEERFAKALAGGKFRIKKWGKIKIEHELRQHGLSEYCIGKGLQEIDDADYVKTLSTLLEKKKKEYKSENVFIIKQKLARYAIGKGYESELVWEILNEME